MAYQDFTFDSVTEKFSLAREERANLFAHVKEREPGSVLKSVLEESVPLGIAIATEKARSEMRRASSIKPPETGSRGFMER